jgi:putative ABC transport system permease protein
MRLQGLTGVTRVTDLQVVRAQMEALTGLLAAFLAVMVLSGVVLATAILFNTATLSVLERRRELATRRALGQRMRAIAVSATVEHGLIALLGLLGGLPVALLCLGGFLRLSSSDLFTLPFWVSGRTVAIAMVGIALVLLLAQWPALRQVARMNLAEVARARD